MSALSRLYTWSLVFESLIFFQVLQQGATGILLNFGRSLQLIALLCLLPKGLQVLPSARLKLWSPIYRNYTIFFCVALLSGVIGALSGAYELSLASALRSSGVQSAFSLFLNSPHFRPIFEYGIYLYYFIYFAVLPQHILKTHRDIKYFFSVFVTFFVASYVLGVIDLALHAAGTGLYLPREMYGGSDVGPRFHGLAGEPRDAFVYLFFGLAMLHLRANYEGKRLPQLWVIAVIVAAMMTQSGSGLVGILLFLVFYSFHFVTKAMSLRKFAVALVVGALIILLGYLNIVSSPRVMLYLDNAYDLYYLLESNKDLPPVLWGQMPNIFPIYNTLVNIREFNILPLLIGSGVGSTSAINQNMGTYFSLEDWGGLTNPHSQFIRIVYETGFVGLYFFYRSFLRPVEYLNRHLERKTKETFMLLMILLLGCFLGHRSASLFIYLGIFIAVFQMPQSMSYGQPNNRSLSGGSVGRAISAHDTQPA